MASFFISYCSFLILWPWTVWRSQFEEDEMWKRKKGHSYLGEGQGAQRVWRERNGGCPEDVGRTGNGAVCAEAAHAADVGQLSRRHVCGSIRVWGTPRGRGGQGNAFCSPVILHNAGQIRLELTAEDIQLVVHVTQWLRSESLLMPLCLLSQQGRSQHALSLCVISIYVDL